MATIFMVVGLLMSTAIGVLLYVSFHAVALQRTATQDRSSKAREAEASVLANREYGFRNRAAVCKDVLRFWDPKHPSSYSVGILVPPASAKP